MFPEKSQNSNNIVNSNDIQNNNLNLNLNTPKRFSGYIRSNSQSQSQSQTKKIPKPVIRSKIVLNNSNQTQKQNKANLDNSYQENF